MKPLPAREARKQGTLPSATIVRDKDTCTPRKFKSAPDNTSKCSCIWCRPRRLRNYTVKLKVRKKKKARSKTTVIVFEKSVVSKSLYTRLLSPTCAILALLTDCCEYFYISNFFNAVTGTEKPVAIIELLQENPAAGSPAATRSPAARAPCTVGAARDAPDSPPLPRRPKLGPARRKTLPPGALPLSRHPVTGEWMPPVGGKKQIRTVSREEGDVRRVEGRATGQTVPEIQVLARDAPQDSRESARRREAAARTALRREQRKKAKVAIRKRSYKCKTCFLTFESVQSRDSHFGGAPHKRKLTKNKEGSSECEVCDRLFPTKLQLEEHIGGRRHRNRVKLQRKLAARAQEEDDDDDDDDDDDSE